MKIALHKKCAEHVTQSEPCLFLILLHTMNTRTINHPDSGSIMWQLYFRVY